MALNVNLVHQRFRDIRDAVVRLDAISQVPLEAFLAYQDMRSVSRF